MGVVVAGCLQVADEVPGRLGAEALEGGTLSSGPLGELVEVCEARRRAVRAQLGLEQRPDVGVDSTHDHCVGPGSGPDGRAL